MKLITIILIIFLLTGCDLIKPLPGNDNITIGQEGVGIDQWVDKIAEKFDQAKESANKIKNSIKTFKKTGEIIKDSTVAIIKLAEEHADLEAVIDDGGQGKSTRLYQDGQFTHTINAELKEPQSGYFYEGWLVRDAPLDFISTGRLILETDGKYHLNFVVNGDYTAYNKVVVSLEPDDGNEAPAGHILEGEFE